MKETNKATRVFCIGWILCNCTYLFAAMMRSHLYTAMMENNTIEEAIIQRIDLLDTVTLFMKYALILLVFFTILYLAERLCHTALQKDCRFACIAFAICMMLSSLSVFIFQIPERTAFAPFQYFPQYLFLMGTLAAINAVRKRYDAIHLS